MFIIKGKIVLKLLQKIEREECQGGWMRGLLFDCIEQCRLGDWSKNSEANIGPRWNLRRIHGCDNTITDGDFFNKKV